MYSKKPNSFLAPLAIVGITIGCLGAAYKFIFVDSKRKENAQAEKPNNKTSKYQSGKDEDD